MAQFNLRKFLIDVFNPEADENVLVMVDLPHGNFKDTNEWRDRREMAEEWRQEFVKLSRERNFSVLPLLTYLATGAHGAPLPEVGRLANEEVKFEDLFPKVTLIVTIAEFSATAAVIRFAEKLPRFRGASMPLVHPSMQETGLAADYKLVQKRCKELREYMRKAEGIEVEFSTGHRCFFDLRYRQPFVDDGMLHTSVWGTGGDAILNLPGGEVFEVPYEGEREGEPSMTEGELPVEEGGDRVVFVVKENSVVDIEGDGPQAKRWRDIISIDRGRKNIAEVAFGCNEKADPFGPIIEKEKSGFHWALGASDHLGGIFNEDKFDNPANSLHEDIVYSGHNTAKVKRATVVEKDGSKITVMEDGEYVI